MISHNITLISTVRETKNYSVKKQKAASSTFGLSINLDAPTGMPEIGESAPATALRDESAYGA